MEQIKTKQLSKILSDKIIRREMLDDSKPGRFIEKIECTSRGSILIKYGIDSGLRNEVMIYQMISLHSESNLIPTAYVSDQFGNGMYILALEWVDGNHPDFTAQHDISIVFSALGKWAAHWSKQIDLFSEEFVSPLNHHHDLYQLIEQNQSILRTTLGDKTYELLYALQSKGEIIISEI